MVDALKQRLREYSNFESLFVPLAIFIFINLIAALIGFFTIAVWIQNRAATTEASTSAANIRTLYSSLSDTESAQRAYIITSDQSRLATYERGRERAKNALGAVKNDRKLATLPDTGTIIETSEAKLVEMEQTLQIRNNQGIEAAARKVNQNLENDLMGRDSTLTNSIVRSIDNEIAMRAARINTLSVVALVTIPFNLIASFGLAYSAYQLLKRQRRNAATLEQLNTELGRSNRELQDFASVASHDLQEPLRKIQAFGDRLATRQEQLDEDGRLYLSRMLDASRRMRTLIEDLLQFSRVTTKAQPFKRTSIKRVIAGVLSDLEVRIADSGATVTVKSLPVVQADELQMRQLFQNLISNALKFHTPDTPPVVTITGKSFRDVEVPYAEITVTDNGIGFDEKYRDRIFTIFQRLHGRDEYEGTGIGLAVVKKIVDRHSGTITAHSTPGEGATFIITLPLAGHDTMMVEDPKEGVE